MRCGGLILAAGASTRLGRPKQLVRIGGETLLDRSIRIAREAELEPIVVILGASEALIREQCQLHGVVAVTNAEWREGMGTSLARGAREFEGVRGVVVMTCDMPAVSASHLKQLADSDEVTASAYAGQRGVPAYFPREALPDLIALKGDAGARGLLRAAALLALDGGELDIDTEDDLGTMLREVEV